MNGDEMAQAMFKLRSLYPNERVELWIAVAPGQQEEHYTASVGETGTAVYGWGKSALAAVETLVKRAGSRDPAGLVAERIGRLHEELQNLKKQYHQLTNQQLPE